MFCNSLENFRIKPFLTTFEHFQVIRGVILKILPFLFSVHITQNLIKISREKKMLQIKYRLGPIIYIF